MIYTSTSNPINNKHTKDPRQFGNIIYIILCLLNKHDKCNFREVSCNNKNTISLCPYIELRPQKQNKKTALNSSQRGTNIQYKSILLKKGKKLKRQRNIVINAL